LSHPQANSNWKRYPPVVIPLAQYPFPRHSDQQVRGSKALCQGLTLVGPLRVNKDEGFSPCAFFFAR
jgi:hypothetical protein